MPEVASQTQVLTVKKRNGQLVPFFEIRILNAIASACKAHQGIPQESVLSPNWQQKMQDVAQAVVQWCHVQAKQNPVIFIEDIQNTVVGQLAEKGYPQISSRYSDYRHQQETKRYESERITVEKRDGRFVTFKPEKIAIAVGKAFVAAQGNKELSAQDKQAVLRLADRVVADLRRDTSVHTTHIEEIQDAVEKVLMDENFHDIGRGYILYREEHRKARAEQKETVPQAAPRKRITIILPDGKTDILDEEQLKLRIAECCHGLEDTVSVERLFRATFLNCFDRMKASDILEAIMLAARSFVEEEPIYSYVAARLLLTKNYKEVTGKSIRLQEMITAYPKALGQTIRLGVEIKRYHKDLLSFDLERLGRAIKPERDLLFSYMGLQTLYDRYFVHREGQRIETPQIFWMRVAMGLATKEEASEKDERAIEFYDVLSRFRFVSSTPTLFNAGTLRPQLSSCYLTTIQDDLDHIFKCMRDNALLSKWSGGLGNDWTPVRGLGARIKGTNGRSQGVIPFMKVANDTAVAVNQGGKRQGAVCAYLEIWHLDIEEFLDLRKNTGDDRRRTHDMHTANWIPDLFMKRLRANANWTLFSSNEAGDLHDLYGRAFEKRYEEYEALAKAGKLGQSRSISAIALWRKMLSMLFETGHPWITFKDPSNIRSPQDHEGVVHSSNLCTEILLNTSENETAVCNLGSINLAIHTTSTGLDEAMLRDSVRTAIRMLDNVIDINYYPTSESKNSNLKHRPIGMGLMGFQDALYIQGYSYASREAVDFADYSMELISYHAILASSHLAKERGVYASFPGSKWDRGILPIDSIKILKEERDGFTDVDTTVRLDWTPVRDSIAKFGMRNSNTMAIAPTATIANITGVTQSIEPTYKNLFVKSNLSGEFTVMNPYLVEELKALGLWDQQMIGDLKYFDGSLREISRIPQAIQDRYVTAFEIDFEWLIEAASRRQKWIDMGQSLNLYMAEPSGKKLHRMYTMAWEKGLKTTYYLRSLGATRTERYTVDVNKYGNPLGQKDRAVKEEPKACSIVDPDCEACQ